MTNKMQRATDSGTGASNAAELYIGQWSTRNVDLFVDTSGSATLTVEVKSGAGSWRPGDSFTYSSSVSKIEQLETTYPNIRAYLDTNRNLVEMVVKDS